MISKVLSSATGFVLLFITLFTASPAEAVEVLDVEMRPPVSWSGPDSRIRKAEIRLIESRRGWIDLWCRHKGVPADPDENLHYNRAGVPLVDFGRFRVLAIFKGESWNSTGVKAVTLAEEKDRILFRFDDKSYQTLGGADGVTAFGLFVLPRSNKPVHVEENVQGLKGKPATWKRWGVFGRRSMKGWELYAWKNANEDGWSFSLLHGTNRIKSYGEVTAEDVRLRGCSALLEKLRELGEKQCVVGFHGRVTVPEGKSALAVPPREILVKIADFCRIRGIGFGGRGLESRKKVE